MSIFFIKNMINCFRWYVNFTLSITLKYYKYMLYRTMKNYQAFFQDTRLCFGYKPNFGSYLAASDRPSFSQNIFGDGSVRLNRYKKYSKVIRLVS